jgi:hypothetical protein
VRDVYWGRASKSPIKKEGVKLATAGDFATVEYMVPDIEGAPIHQKNLNLYGVYKGIWIDVHVSKTEFADKDQAAFDEVVKNLKFESPKAAATKPGRAPAK